MYFVISHCYNVCRALAAVACARVSSEFPVLYHMPVLDALNCGANSELERCLPGGGLTAVALPGLQRPAAACSTMGVLSEAGNESTGRSTAHARRA